MDAIIIIIIIIISDFSGCARSCRFLRIRALNQISARGLNLGILK